MHYVPQIQMSDLTYKIVAYKVNPNFQTDECVDWAIDLLEKGIETEHILIIAALDKPTNYFETTQYVEKALQELKLTSLTGREGIISLATFYASEIAKSCNVRTNLKKLCDLCIDLDYNKLIFDFYLLYWAWSDLDFGNEIQEYWPDATKDNIESIAVNYARNWISENKNTVHNNS